MYSSDHVKATRKQHVCEYCGGEIAAVGVLMVLAAKNAKRKMEDGRKADEK